MIFKSYQTKKTGNSLPNSVTCLCHSNNHMWIGMVREGVLGAEKRFYHYLYQSCTKTQPQACPTNAPYAYGKIKTDGSGLVRTEAVSTALTRKTERFTHYPQTLGEKIVSICPLSETELLASSFSKGIFRFNKKDRKLTSASLFRTKMQKQSWQAPVHPPIYELMIGTK